MIKLKTEEEIEILRENAILVSKTLGEVGKAIVPGVTTKKLDQIAETFIRDHGAVPGFLGYGGFPYTLCISVNDTVVHGFPSDYCLKEGDIVSVDCGTVYKGFNGDSAYTFAVGEIDPETAKLLEVTKKSLYLGAQKAVAGNRIGDIGFAVQHYCEENGFSVVRELVGHGIGKRLHEAPEVPNYGRAGQGKKLAEGMVICIEPMVNAGVKDIYLEDNGWDVRTADGKNSAHFEFMVAVKKGVPEVLTTFEYIENK
ncbi:MAG: type I methionyl aminopeptidase [Bacteroidales bacterium]|nr:type I methionyl aminopeptidase [Bacteroidales bacterium]MBQ3522229.1 type I methionyl aminopeptidase [Bacteroidales bacterium]MBQ6872627.1 type I methionyl aminopeptidase [Bacteroidales bacterium]MBR4094766.1 type I methionyl aminopeptidase [Bacteroidales bacterium]